MSPTFEAFLNLTLILIAVGAVWIISCELINAIVVEQKHVDAILLALPLAMTSAATHALTPGVRIEGLLVIAAIAACTWKASRLHDQGVV
ncbi:hypothetical protein E4H12_01940 [Candidatus Thorarchaeota archaeon]|nr:MAG: hypothetical protein E4H12_01940 [Candidatus Thorarchaeota archaeon]